MTEHTELPWAVASNDRAIIRPVPDLADGYDHYTVGVMSSHSLIGHEEAKANAAYIVKACNAFPDLVKALEESRSALIAFMDAVQASQKMSGREYVGLGIQVNNAIGNAWNVLTAVGQVRSPSDG